MKLLAFYTGGFVFVNIPRRLLPHSITHHYEATIDARGKKTFGKSQVVNFVRVEEVKQTILTAQGKQADDKYKLFVDCKNTYPQQNYEIGDEIEFNSVQYEIRQIEPKYTTSATPHHLEIYLR